MNTASSRPAWSTRNPVFQTKQNPQTKTLTFPFTLAFLMISSLILFSLDRDHWLCASSRPGHKDAGKQSLVLEPREQTFATGVAIFVEFCA